MQRYYALLTDGTLRDIGLHESWEAANKVEPQNTIWLVSGEDANQWRETLGPPTGEVVLIGHMGEAQPAFREPCHNTLTLGSPPPLIEEALIEALEIEPGANEVSMGIHNASMNLTSQAEAPDRWRVYLRGSNLQFSFGLTYKALHPAVAVEQCRAQHAAGGLIKDSSEYLAIRHREDDALRSYRIEYDAAPEAMGQGAVVDAHSPTEAVRIARWVFLIPAALSVTVRRHFG